jgi:hypothetical protein
VNFYIPHFHCCNKSSVYPPPASVHILARFTAVHVPQRKECPGHWWMWPHRQYDELVPHVCLPCVHEQHASCTSIHGNQVGWGSVIALANSINPNPRPIQWLGKYCSACQQVRAEAPLCWSAFVTMLTEAHLPTHLATRLQIPAYIALVSCPPRRMVKWSDRHLHYTIYQWKISTWNSLPQRCVFTSDHKCDFLVLFTRSQVRWASSANKIYWCLWGCATNQYQCSNRLSKSQVRRLNVLEMALLCGKHRVEW